jgi:hypothetical protein
MNAHTVRGALVAIITVLAMLAVLPASRVSAGSAGPDAPAGSGCSAGWQTISSIDVASVVDRLRGVAAVSATDAWAVGASYDFPSEGESEYAGNSALIQRWDGTSWSVVAAPEVDALGAGLNDVAARSSSYAWAVGSSTSLVDGLPVQRPLIVHWDGASWAAVPAPGAGPHGNGVLKAVLALRDDDAWAVGYYRPDAGADEKLWPLTLHWNGSSWSVVDADPALVEHYASARFDAISASSSSDVWAVGSGTRDGTINETLVQRWDGKQWSIVASPSPGVAASRSFGSELHGVVARGPGDVVAVGTTGTSAYAIRWDGRRWSRLRVPVAEKASLQGVVALPSGSIAGVGHQMNSETFVGESFAVDITRTVAVVPTEQVADSFETSLFDVAVADGMQWAVGSSVRTQHDGSSRERTLIQRRCTQ